MKEKIWIIEEKVHWGNYEPRYAHKSQKKALAHMKCLRGLAGVYNSNKVYRIEVCWRKQK